MSVDWSGVMPAITTPFQEDGSVDHKFLAEHARWMIAAGATAIVPCGSLGEGNTLDHKEKCAILRTLVAACGPAPVIPGIGAASTEGAVRLASAAAEAGCKGLMVLPPYVHSGPWFEVQHHFSAIFDATALPCMLYNNPIAYGVDCKPKAIADLAAQHPNMKAVKESSGDIRRLTAIRNLCGDDLALFVGLDDLLLEGVAMGAQGWIAGLVNAFPRESVILLDLARRGAWEEARELYSWFLPLLRLDTVPEFVQLIKLVQARCGMGSERVRLPRQPAQGQLLEHALSTIEEALRTRPTF